MKRSEKKINTKIYLYEKKSCCSDKLLFYNYSIIDVFISFMQSHWMGQNKNTENQQNSNSITKSITCLWIANETPASPYIGIAFKIVSINQQFVLKLLLKVEIKTNSTNLLK